MPWSTEEYSYCWYSVGITWPETDLAYRGLHLGVYAVNSQSSRVKSLSFSDFTVACELMSLLVPSKVLSISFIFSAVVPAIAASQRPLPATGSFPLLY